jgi:hypothetical protein
VCHEIVLISLVSGVFERRINDAAQIPSDLNGNFKTSGGTESFADDLCKERGIVRGRVGLFPRSSEIKPLFHDS